MTNLIVYNAKISTIDPQRRGAQAIATNGGRIYAVGDDAEIVRLAIPTPLVIDARGRRLIPGLIDSHGR